MKVHVFLRFATLILYLALVRISSAQIPETEPPYSIHIRAELDPAARELAAEYDLRYTNQTPDTLHELVIHLWAQAFSSPLTAYGRQKRLFGDTEFYFLKDDQRIRYSFLQFSSGKTFLDIEQVGDDPDIVRIRLGEPLPPGEQVDLHADYHLALPGFHSRLGTDGTIWQLAHWFPKPARYVDHAWQAIPYLELGEFTQDFARYQVDLTLPDSFVVVATGEPADQATYELRELALETTRNGSSGMPERTGTRQTWSFKADWVPDMALACSAAFFLQDGLISLSDGRKARGQVAYLASEAKRWESAMDDVDRSIRFYDQHVGPYPWPFVTAVQGVREFSGGMEYPMLTYIQPGLPAGALEEVIAHEIGHNWFFGVLSTNEREYPWLDEGLNSYYDHRYTQSVRHGRSAFGSLDMEGWLLLGEAGKRLLPIPGHGIRDVYAEIDYQLGAYTIPTRNVQVLEDMYGTDAIDRAFQAYYSEWKFRHPGPEDLRRVFESSLQTDLSWLFDQAIHQPFSRDISIRSVRMRGDSLNVSICQKGTTGLPFRIRQLDGETVLSSHWSPGFTGRDTTLLLAPEGSVDLLSVRDGLIPDLRQINDLYRPFSNWHRPKLLGLGFGGGVTRAQTIRHYLLPVVGYNVYDGFQAGLALHNQGIYYQPSGYFLSGLYGFRSGQLGYTGALYRDIYLKEGPSLVRLGLKARSASYFTLLDDLRLRYHRFNPYVEWQTRAEIRRGETHWKAGLYGWLNGRETIRFGDTGPAGVDDALDWDRIIAFRSTVTRRDVLLPWMIHLDVEYQPYRDALSISQAYLKTGLEARIAFPYMAKRYIRMRSYLGGFPYNTRREAGNVSNPSTRGSLALSFQGLNDYRFEETFIGRSEQTGTSSRQILLREGGFKTALGSAFGAGQSNNLIASVNLVGELPLPNWLPVQIYTDLGYWSDRTFLGRDKTFADQVWWDLGLQYSLFGDRIQFFLPLVQNQPLAELLDQRESSLLKRITWTVRLDIAQLPWDFPSLF